MQRTARRLDDHTLKWVACCLTAGLLAAGCEPQPTERDNEQLTRAQEATPLRDASEERDDTGRADAPAEPQADAAPQSPEPAARGRDAGVVGGPAPAGSSGGETARAVLEPTEGQRASGTVEFRQQQDGGLMVVVMLQGLEPGPHGLHVHETGDCSAPDAASAEGHFTPENDPHGSPQAAPDVHHAGDFGNVNADDDGVAEARFADDELALDGEFGVVGRAVIVHRDRDDLRTQPDGNAGDRVACGVIRPAAPARRQVG